MLPRRGVWVSADEIVITIGAQQALYLLADLLITERTTVGMEDPGYPDARNIFASRTARIVGLKVNEGGMLVDGSLRGCDYVYVTPSHQCPATVTMPMARREQLLSIAEDENIILFEDDYESENCYSGSPIPALKSIDRNGRVVYIGSLSKSLAPGLRLGYIVASPELVNEIRALRRLMVRHPATFIQRSISLFLSLGHHDAHTRRLSHIYNKRAQALMDALSRHLPQVTFVPVSGGASCWVRGPDWLDCRELARVAEGRGVLIEPGDVFFMAQSPPRNYFRIGFTSIPADKIEQGHSRARSRHAGTGTPFQRASSRRSHGKTVSRVDCLPTAPRLLGPESQLQSYTFTICRCLEIGTSECRHLALPPRFDLA